MTQQKSRSRFVPWLIFLVFAFPLALAFWFYKNSDRWDLNMSNYGELISPPLALPMLVGLDHDEITADNWLIFFVNVGECGDICRDNLYHMRQSWLALGKERDRVSRMLINTDAPSAALQEVVETDFSGTRIEELVVGNYPFVLEHIYVADPLGNVILHYSPEADPQGLRKDLSKLLKVSKIG